MKAVFSALVRVYQWSRSHLQAFGYGIVLIGMAKLGFGDVLMGLVGLVAIVGGFQAIWAYVMEPDRKAKG